MTGQGREAVDALLAESFKELALKQPIEKITIKEITDKAGLIRPTFYNHFQDKYERIEWIIMTELLKPMEPLLQNGMVDEALLLLFTKIERERDFYTRACRLEGQNSFESIAKGCVERVLLRIIQETPNGKLPKYVWLTPELIAEYYAQSMCYVLLRWIESGMTISGRELIEVYNYMMKHSMDEVLKELSG